jgi:site-specific recombinase XerC
MATRRRLLRPQALKPAQTSKSWLEAFVDYAAGECHLSDNTVAAYRRDLDHFYTWLDRRNVVDLSIRDLADYVSWLHGRKLAPASIARHIVSLKVFFRYLQLEAVLTQNLAGAEGSQHRAGRSAAFEPRASRSMLAARSGDVGIALCDRLPCVGSVATEDA